MKVNLEASLPGCRNFTWGEALYLPTWDVHVIPPQDVLDRIYWFAPKVQRVRDILDAPMRVHNWYRPPVYNLAISGSTGSWHKKGGALDFDCSSDYTANQVRRILEPELERLGLRMEDLPDANWIHIDDKPIGHKRFFKP